MMTEEKKYEMPALTNNQREEIIDRLVIFRKAIQSSREDNTQTETDESDDLIARITLAALNARPMYEGIRSYVNEEGTEITYLCELRPWMYKSTEESRRRIVYTAPPVPELKLPDVSEGDPGKLHDVRTRHDFSNGFRFAIEEVKRLNGVKS